VQTQLDCFEGSVGKKPKRFLNRYKDGLLNFFRGVLRDPGAPKTTNSAEFTFAFLRPFLNMIKSFQSPEFAQKYLDIFTLFFNLRKFKSGQFEGLCPYEIAGLNV
jgi:hypothetical protein